MRTPGQATYFVVFYFLSDLTLLKLAPFASGSCLLNTPAGASYVGVRSHLTVTLPGAVKNDITSTISLPGFNLSFVDSAKLF